MDPTTVGNIVIAVLLIYLLSIATIACHTSTYTYEYEMSEDEQTAFKVIIFTPLLNTLLASVLIIKIVFLKLQSAIKTLLTPTVYYNIILVMGKYL